MAFLYHNPEIWQLPNKQSMEKKCLSKVKRHENGLHFLFHVVSNMPVLETKISSFRGNQKVLSNPVFSSKTLNFASLCILLSFATKPHNLCQTSRLQVEFVLHGNISSCLAVPCLHVCSPS